MLDSTAVIFWYSQAQSWIYAPIFNVSHSKWKLIATLFPWTAPNFFKAKCDPLCFPENIFKIFWATVYMEIFWDNELILFGNYYSPDDQACETWLYIVEMAKKVFNVLIAHCLKFLTNVLSQWILSQEQFILPTIKKRALQMSICWQEVTILFVLSFLKRKGPSWQQTLERSYESDWYLIPWTFLSFHARCEPQIHANLFFISRILLSNQFTFRFFTQR